MPSAESNAINRKIRTEFTAGFSNMDTFEDLERRAFLANTDWNGFKAAQEKNSRH